MNTTELGRSPREQVSDVGDIFTFFGELTPFVFVRARALERAVELVRCQPGADSSWVNKDLVNFGEGLFSPDRLKVVTRMLITGEASKIGLHQARAALAFTGGGDLGQETRPISGRLFSSLLDFAERKGVVRVRKDSRDLLIARELLIPGWASLIPLGGQGNEAFFNFERRAEGQLAGVKDPVFSLPPSVPGRLLACAAAHWGIGEAMMESPLFKERLFPFLRNEAQRYAVLAGVFTAAMPEALSLDRLMVLIDGLNTEDGFKMRTLLGPEADFGPPAMAYRLRFLRDYLYRVKGEVGVEERKEYFETARSEIWPLYKDRLSSLFPQLTSQNFEEISKRTEYPPFV